MAWLLFGLMTAAYLYRIHRVEVRWIIDHPIQFGLGVVLYAFAIALTFTYAFVTYAH